MIEKLRRKFIFINMLLVTLVLLIVFGVLVGSNYRQLERQTDRVLSFALELGRGGDAFPKVEVGPRTPPVPEHDAQIQTSMIPAFAVTLDADGAVTEIIGNNVDVSDEVVAQAVAAVRASEAPRGRLSALDLSYLRSEDGQHIAFAHRGWLRSSLTALIKLSLLVGLGALAVFFLISLFLANWALRPARRAWEQQRQFVADASHELKTPLTVILTNTELLLSHPQKTVGEQQKWLRYIRDEAQQMRGLVESMLFLARHDVAGHAAAHSQLDLSSLVMEALLPFEPVAFEAGVTLKSDVEPGLSLSGEADQLRRLVGILLDNACKYAGAGGTITLSLSHAGEHAVLRVTNTGEPIAPEHLAHLFERFYRPDSARTRAEGGYGLGLAIAKRIAEDHRASISVSSNAAHGTAFTVSFPRQTG